MSEAPETAPIEFTAVEARALACLMEKELSTPDNYPLTLNSLTLACNQKSNREPVMNLTQGEVGHTVNTLADRELLHIEYGDRAQRIAHRMRGTFKLDRRQQAVLAVLMLRRPQTLNDLKTRTQRMADFADLAEVQQVVDQLIERDPPLALCIPRDAGRREDRYAHTLCGEVVPDELENAARRPAKGPESGVSPSAAARNARLDDLEQRIAQLEVQVQQLLGEKD